MLRLSEDGRSLPQGRKLESARAPHFTPRRLSSGPKRAAEAPPPQHRFRKSLPLAAGMRPVATYSIVARDPETGQLGVAVQSHWFSVGSVVPWAEAGVGAVATQSFVEPSYGPLGLALMGAGKSADEALRALLEVDPKGEYRQVAFVDSSGRVAVHTGELCIPEAGHVVGEGFSAQANLMSTPDIWPAMAEAYESAEGDLAHRLLAALEAAEEAGGDIRGMQSAAILVVSGRLSGRSWGGVIVDLRVEDHPGPLEELRRLLRLHEAYTHSNRGDELMAEGRVEEALGEYERAAELAPEVVELPFWQAVTLASSGRVEEALPIFERVFKAEERWVEVLRRLPRVGMLEEGVVRGIFGSLDL